MSATVLPFVVERFERVVEEKRAALQVTELLCARMEADGVSRSDLARRLGVSPATITNLLNSSCTSISLRRAARVAYALGYRITLRLDRLPGDQGPESAGSGPRASGAGE